MVLSHIDIEMFLSLVKLNKMEKAKISTLAMPVLTHKVEIQAFASYKRFSFIRVCYLWAALHFFIITQ
jgi:hypothetical protein